MLSGKASGQFQEGEPCPSRVVVHSVRTDVKSGYTRLVLDQSADGVEIHADNIRDGRIRDRYESGGIDAGSFGDVPHQLVITAQDGVGIVQP